MRRILRAVAVAAVLTLPVFGIGCGGKDKMEEAASTRPGRLLEASPYDTGALAENE